MKQYGQLAIIKKADHVMKALATGCTKVILSQKISGAYRLPVAQYLVGEDSTFLAKQGKHLIAGDALCCFYNRSYETERTVITNYLATSTRKHSLVVLGAGTGVISLYLSPHFSYIVNYDSNRKAIAHALYNIKLNGCKNVFNICQSYEFAKPADVVISMMPSLPIDSHKKIKFNHLLIGYYLVKKEDIIDSPYQYESHIVKQYSSDLVIKRVIFRL